MLAWQAKGEVFWAGSAVIQQFQEKISVVAVTTRLELQNLDSCYVQNKAQWAPPFNKNLSPPKETLDQQNLS